jgi:signal transduction histidine kinase
MFLFLSLFGVTEYLASHSGNYELNLYSLFVIPIFLIAIVYFIFSLDIFNFKVISTYFFVFGFLILTGSQLIFIKSNTDRLLAIITLLLSVVFSIFLFSNLKKETKQRIEIEKLNIDLGRLVEQRESLMYLINHKVKGSFTHTKYIFSEMLQGSFGEISPETKKMAELGLNSDNLGIRTIDLILNAANLQKGAIKFDFKPVALRGIVLKAVDNKKDLIQKKNLDFELNIGEGDYSVNGDAFWLEEVANNLIDNAFNYTNKGKLTVKLEKKDEKILFSVKDTGVGISKEDKENLFKEGGRGKESTKTNVNSTGYGLYSVKLIVEAHKGRVWAESEGKGKGAEFFVELDAL